MVLVIDHQMLALVLSEHGLASAEIVGVKSKFRLFLSKIWGKII